MRLIVTNAKTFVDGNKAHQALVFKALSFKVPNHHVINAKTGRKWNGIASMHNRRNKTFPSGLLPRVEAFLTHNRFNYVKVDKREMPKKPLWPVSLHDITLRSYQQTSLQRFLTYHRGILQLGTGAGKTEVAVAVAKSCNVPMIFLTHRVNLLHQAAERFVQRWPEAKDLIGIVGAGQHDFRYLTFATVQTMHSTIKKYGKQLLDELRQYGLIIIDEAHRVGAKQFHETADCFPNAFWRLGLTATPFMFEDPRDNLQLEGTLGPVVHKVSSSDLIEAGVLARPYFKFFPINHPVDMGGLTNWRDVYEEGIVYNSFRNDVIVKNAVKLIEMGHKPLIIVQETNHGTILKAGIEVAGKRVSFMTGKDDAALRVRSLKALSAGKVDAVIATNIFDEGIDVKNVSAIILAAGTKSAPSLFQRTGRAIRKKDDGGHAVIIDFIDRQHKTLEKHSLKRVALVKSEPAFKIV